MRRGSAVHKQKLTKTCNPLHKQDRTNKIKRVNCAQAAATKTLQATAPGILDRQCAEGLLCTSSSCQRHSKLCTSSSCQRHAKLCTSSSYDGHAKYRQGTCQGSRARRCQSGQQQAQSSHASLLSRCCPPAHCSKAAVH